MQLSWPLKAIWQGVCFECLSNVDGAAFEQPNLIANLSARFARGLDLNNLLSACYYGLS